MAVYAVSVAVRTKGISNLKLYHFNWEITLPETKKVLFRFWKLVFCITYKEWPKAIPYSAHGFGFETWNRGLFFYVNS